MNQFRQIVLEYAQVTDMYWFGIVGTGHYFLFLKGHRRGFCQKHLTAIVKLEILKLYANTRGAVNHM
jgi:hypothetical protein